MAVSFFNQYKKTMKRLAFNSVLIAFMGIGLISCKEGTKNQSKTGDAEKVNREAKDGSSVTYNLIKEESKILWSGEKAVGGGHNGHLSLKNAQFHVEDGKIVGGKAVIDMTSVHAVDLEDKPDKKKQLEAHLMGTADGKETDFFNVEEYPMATFEVTDFSEKGGKQILSGNLTLKDATKNIEFPVSIKDAEKGKTMRLVSDAFSIDRTKWGVKYGSGSIFDDLTKDKIINDDIELSLQLKMERS